MLAVVLAATIAAPAEAPPGLALSWTAPESCPDEAALRARVVQMTGEEAARTASLSAHATARQEGPERWSLSLELVGPSGAGRRELSAPRCEELMEAAALVVAIAVDPQAALSSAAAPQEEVVPTPPPVSEAEGTGEDGHVDEDMSESAGAEAPAAASVEEPAAAPELTPTASPGRARRVQVGVRAAAGVSFARLAPRTGAAVSLMLSVGGRGWRAELGGLYTPPVTGGPSPEIGGVFQAGAVVLRGCPSLRRGTIEVPLCAGLQVGAMEGRGRGSGLVTTTTARSPWLAVTLGAAMAWRPRAGRVGVWLQADAIAALLRPTFVTAGGVTVHETARFGGQMLAGVEVSLR